MKAASSTIVPETPQEMGFPGNFGDWRRNQRSAIQAISKSSSRFTAVVAPTGFGKSLTYMAALLMSRGRSLIVSSTKNLQDQLLRDFHSQGLVDVRGMSNYPCALEPGLAVDEGPCHAGTQCDYKRLGCAYFDAKRTAKISRLVVSNYDFHLYTGAYGEGCGPWDTIVMDEAHAAPEHLARFLQVYISDSELGKWCSSRPDEENWRVWAEDQYCQLEDRYAQAQVSPSLWDKKLVEAKKQARKLLEKLKRLSAADDSDWVVERYQGKHTGGYRWEVINPARYADQYLFQKAKRIIFVSATLSLKTLEMLGVDLEDKSEYTWLEYPSTFKVARRPVYAVPSAPVRYDSDIGNLRLWLERIDQIIDRRTDRKGVIHTHSYARARFILDHSRHRARLLGSDRQAGALAVAKFKRSPPGTVLCGPAFDTGVDFPYRECEYQIICKVPYPDTRPLIVKARSKRDKLYKDYLAIQEVIQASGRGMRAEDDQCETFLVDDNFRNWFLRKTRRMQPKWFREAVQVVSSIPDPPRRLSK